MKYIAILLMMSLAACSVTVGDIDAAAAKTAVAVCPGVTTAYNAFVATQLGSDRDKAAVDAAYAATRGICTSPSAATAQQVVVLTVQLAVITRALLAARKAQANG